MSEYDGEYYVPPFESTLTPGTDQLTQVLRNRATDEWQRAELSFKADGEVLLIDWVRVTPKQ